MMRFCLGYSRHRIKRTVDSKQHLFNGNPRLFISVCYHSLKQTPDCWSGQHFCLHMGISLFFNRNWQHNISSPTPLRISPRRSPHMLSLDPSLYEVFIMTWSIWSLPEWHDSSSFKFQSVFWWQVWPALTSPLRSLVRVWWHNSSDQLCYVVILPA